MDTAFLLTTTVPNLATSALASDTLSTLLKRLLQAREDYQAKPVEVLESGVEVKRRGVLDQTRSLQTRVILELEERVYLEKALPALLDLETDTYGARSAQELDAISQRAEQLRSFVDRLAARTENLRVMRNAAVNTSVLILALLFAFAVLSPLLGIAQDCVIPLLQIPLSIVLWGSIGSFTALIYRFNKAADAELRNPKRLMLTRPIIGVVMSVISYFVLRVGILASLPRDVVPSLETGLVFWLLAFLVGFSDTLAEGVLRTLVGRFGGDEGSNSLDWEQLPGDKPPFFLPFLETFRRRPGRGEEEPAAEVPEPVPAQAPDGGTDRAAPDLIEIEGVGDAQAEELKAAGLDAAGDLPGEGGPDAGQQDLAEGSGTPAESVSGWVGRVDLSRVPGVGQEYADLLVHAGVAGVADLAQRDPDKLHPQLARINEEKNLVRRQPTHASVSSWVERARALSSSNTEE